MISKIFNSIRDINYVKVTKENWKKIEDLFATKEAKINEQSIKIQELEQLVAEQSLELIQTRKYKANDDMVYTYEELCKDYKLKNKNLEKELAQLSSAINTMDKKVKSALSLESAYLQRIIRAESKTRYCPDYETKGESLVTFYA